MGNNKKRVNKTAIAVAGMLLSGSVLAQGVAQQDQTPLMPLTVIQASDQTLISQGCDPSVMNSLNNEYLMRRSLERNIELRTLVREQVDTTPPPNSASRAGSCFQQAASNINGVISTYNSILALLSGNGDPSSLIAKAGQFAMNAACQQINNYTGQITGSLTQQVNGTIGGAMGAVNGFQIGSGQFGTTGGQILGAISPTTGTAPAGAIPLINSNQIGAATGTNSLFGLGSTAVNSTAGVVGSYMGPTPVNAHQGAPYMGSDAATAANATGCSISNISGCNPFK